MDSFASSLMREVTLAAQPTNIQRLVVVVMVAIYLDCAANFTRQSNNAPSLNRIRQGAASADLNCEQWIG
jgi:hypothetical protein